MTAFQRIEISHEGSRWYNALQADSIQKACRDLGLPLDWVGKANRMDLVRGREPDRVTLLVSLKTLQSLAKDSPKFAYGKTGFWVRWTFGIKGGFSSDPNDESGSTVIIHKNLFFIQACCLISDQNQIDSFLEKNPDDTNPPELINPFLVELADPRVIGQLTTAKARFNVVARYTQQDLNNTDLFDNPADAPVYEPCSADDSGNTAKPNLAIAQALWGLLPSQFGSFPSFFPSGSFIDKVSENLRYEGVNAWDAFCHFIGTLGVSVAYNVSQNKFYLIDKQEQDSGAIDDLDDPSSFGVRLATGSIRGSDCILPKTVRVFFPRDDGGCGDYQCSDPHYTKDVQTTDILGQDVKLIDASELVIPIHDTMWAGFSLPTDSTPFNESDLVDRANAVATRFLKSVAYRGNTGDIYAGIGPDVFPKASLSRITIFDFGNGMQTQAVYGPNEDSFSRFPQRNRYVSPSDYLGSLDTYNEAFSPFEEPENDGYSGVRTRILDMFFDDDHTKVIAQIEKAIFVDGRLVGVCRLYDIDFCAASITGYTPYAPG